MGDDEGEGRTGGDLNRKHRLILQTLDDFPCSLPPRFFSGNFGMSEADARTAFAELEARGLIEETGDNCYQIAAKADDTDTFTRGQASTTSD